jgi:enoyl-[acyl-carrier protein] reductase I
MIDLSGRRGLVVSLSSENSFGYQIARELVRGGAEVAGTTRPAHGSGGATLARAAGCARHFALDCDDERSVLATFDELARDWGRLDFVVHTVMTVPPGAVRRPLVELSRPDFERTLAIGAHSLILLAQRALPLLEKSAAPRIVACTFAGSQRVVPNYHVGGICKAALEATVRYLAYELGEKGVLVNALSTTMVATDVVTREWGDAVAARTRALVSKRAPARAATEFADLTAAVAWMVSADLRHITGDVLHVDGGYSLTYL